MDNLILLEALNHYRQVTPLTPQEDKLLFEIEKKINEQDLKIRFLERKIHEFVEILNSLVKTYET